MGIKFGEDLYSRVFIFVTFANENETREIHEVAIKFFVFSFTSGL